jgi:hypothetical protein
MMAAGLGVAVGVDDTGVEVAVVEEVRGRSVPVGEVGNSSRVQVGAGFAGKICENVPETRK